MKQDELNIIVTTGSEIPGHKILECRGPVIVNDCIAGNMSGSSNPLSGDIDIFRQIPEVQDRLTEQLKVKAADLGCNAIINYSMQHYTLPEIKSDLVTAPLVITIYGTAVVILKADKELE